MRVVFMGTPEFSVPVLTRIAGQGHEIAAVYTRAPKPAGRRGLELSLSPVHLAAQRLGIDVLTPKTLRAEDAAATLAAFRPEVVVVVAYGLLLPRAILDVPPRGCLNLHGSLLPRWRGAAPIQRAIMAGDRETGVMVMAMEDGLDTGPVALTERIAITSESASGELFGELAELGAGLMARALALLEKGELAFTPQSKEGVTYAHKIDKSEARIDWRKSAPEIHNLIRGLSPAPGAFFEADLGKGTERIKVLRTSLAKGSGSPGAILDGLTIACGEGAIQLLDVQRAGKGPIKAADFLRGAKLGKALPVQPDPSDAAL
ncbi:methionyl-tRNA formyltransferase [Methylocapsa palsarum]|uniref:Methionyl-tRNA formyltransferase n=1 Tax=Methylocapsa palsarum TaxID=1612308 RepID=A0A1I3Z1Z7_9HYPH|nr:methionyl-tRNA formyltransferase [Methylocapsa palsarum]SFK38123.1 methionyl-tRNA formyltransferase [Methylocapsa palsarum]